MQSVIDIIKQYNDNGDNVMIVVSALSSDLKSEGTTSCLLSAAHNAINGGDFNFYIKNIQRTHFKIIDELFSNDKLRNDASSFILSELNKVSSMCSAVSIINELSTRSHDKIIGSGERMAAYLTSAILNDQGYNSNFIDLCNIFDDNNGNLLDINRNDYETLILNKIQDKINECGDINNCIPVITGFFGLIKDGIINSIGRGYSDYTAALCAASMSAKQLQVWKESGGIFTGNPLKINDAHLLSYITSDEVSELTYFGNHVLNAFTVRCTMNHNIPIYILDTFKPKDLGTIVVYNDNDNKIINGNDNYDIPISAITSKNGINVINISLNNGQHHHYQLLPNIFELFKRHNCKIDLISTSITNISIAIHESVPIISIKNLINDLVNEFPQTFDENNINLNTNKSIVTCIGSGTRRQSGISSKIFTCLAKEGINIEMISQGSGTSICVNIVIDSDDMDNAIEVIHKEYIRNNNNNNNKEQSLKTY